MANPVNLASMMQLLAEAVDNPQLRARIVEAAASAGADPDMFAQVGQQGVGAQALPGAGAQSAQPAQGIPPAPAALLAPQEQQNAGGGGNFLDALSAVQGIAPPATQPRPPGITPSRGLTSGPLLQLILGQLLQPNQQRQQPPPLGQLISGVQ